MKKIFCFSVCMLIGAGAALANGALKEFAKGCGFGYVTLSGNQEPEDDEYLFDSKAAYNSVPNKNGQHAVNGKAYECDNEYCTGGTEIHLGPGHVFKGNVVNEYRTYTCKTGGINDHWEYVKTETMCGETHVSYDGIQGPNDNEFLYSSKMAYNSAKNRADGGTIAGGLVYECDNEHCTHGQVQDMPAGHVFNGQEVNEAAKYRCDVDVEDKWVRIYEGCEYMGKKIAIGDWYVDSTGKKISLDYAQCSQFQDMNPGDINKRFNAKCEIIGGENKMHCYPIDGGDEAPVKPESCPEGSSSSITSSAMCKAGEAFECAKWDGKTCKCGLCKKSEQPVKPASCPEGSSSSITSSAMCKAGEAFECAKWDGKTCKCGLCKTPGQPVKPASCPEGSSSSITSPAMCKADEAFECAKWNGATCKCGLCKTPGQPPEKPEVPWDCSTMTNQMANLIKWRSECVAEVTIMNQISEIMTMCTDGKMTQGMFTTLYNALVVLKPEQCDDRAIDKKQKEVKQGVARIDEIVGGWGKSVWKDKEGNFNTARLASDSIAGVVLGTTGALVTSHVVKKNQVEGGFEDIQCVIGGQTVAGWGDQFQVGIQ